MKSIMAIVVFVFTTLGLSAQTKSTSTQKNKTITTAKSNQKKPATSHSGAGLENTGTTAITLTHDDSVNYQRAAKKGTTTKPASTKKPAHKGR